MRMVLAIAALVSIAFGLIAVGRAWYEFRPLTDKERARLRQEGNSRLGGFEKRSATRALVLTVTDLYLSHLQVGRRLGKGRCAMRITDSDSSWKRRE
jgi:hypothetical protein